ncbi:MAG TPA: amino acid adenylation domain-containing protein, partial [Actinomycetales bacterium]
MLLLASDRATSERTLLDILRETAARHPAAPALDDGTTVLDYAALLRAVDATADLLRRNGVRRGDRVGVRITSGSNELYVSILAVLRAGAAYVPVDADDPDERADLVFTEAAVSAVVTDGPAVTATGRRGPSSGDDHLPAPDDDAWVIFTSGSTGTPKGVAVTHRSAAAFVDAEARLFVQERPLAPGDRVLAGLSVAFDASCEEMWLAWRHGACLVPAPRALVRSGSDLGPWLVEQQVTAVSTVPTLASLWPSEALQAIRLLIFGGEACPPELADRLAVPGREVWNTYGPTEATVVACAHLLTRGTPVRIGLPLDGWDLAVVDAAQQPVAEGATGELVIGGVGLARYLDPAKDAEKFAPMLTLGWQRAYRSGDLVRAEAQGLVFVGRADDQVKLGGRRIELGEVDAALQSLPGVVGAAAAVRTTAAGNHVLVGYVVPAAGTELDRALSLRRLRDALPAALVPQLVPVDDLPTRTSGKVDRDALPWPVTAEGDGQDAGSAGAGWAGADSTAGWLAEQWARILGVSPTGVDDDFFDSGGSSLTAAQLVSALRTRFPEVTVADVYENPTLGALADTLDEFTPAVAPESRTVRPVPVRAQVVQWLVSVPVATLVGLRWLTWAAALANAARWWGATWAPATSWWLVAAGWLLLVSPLGRLGVAAAGARLLLRGVRPGSHPRGGSVHLRLWAAETWTAAAGAGNVSAAPWVSYYARALGASVARGVHLHTMPPVTGLLTLGPGCSVEPEVDLAGHWLDGDVLHVGRVRIGAGALVGRRSTLLPGARVGQGAQVAAGSSVSGAVPPGELWGGSPAHRLGVARHDWPTRRPPRARPWVLAYGATSAALGALPLVGAGVTAAAAVAAADDESTLRGAAGAVLMVLAP